MQTAIRAALQLRPPRDPASSQSLLYHRESHHLALIYALLTFSTAEGKNFYFPTIMAETAPAQTAMPTTGAPAAPTNGVTTGASNAPSDQNTANRGLPYYEKLRRELRDTIQKKRLMDKSMVSRVACRKSRPNSTSTTDQWKTTERIESELRPAIALAFRL